MEDVILMRIGRLSPHCVGCAAHPWATYAIADMVADVIFENYDKWKEITTGRMARYGGTALVFEYAEDAALIGLQV